MRLLTIDGQLLLVSLKMDFRLTKLFSLFKDLHVEYIFCVY